MRWFVSLKSYGDLVIACNALSKENISDYGLLAGTHLHDLIGAIGYSGRMQYIDTGITVPALFDFKKKGFVDAAISGINIYKYIHNAIQAQDTLIFDKINIRQKIIAAGFNKESFACGAPNIYEDYQRYLGLKLNSEILRFEEVGKSVLVFPDSRISNKKINEQLQAQIAYKIISSGRQATIVRIGQQASQVSKYTYTERWLSGFNNLVEVIKAADGVVSADSLPAHIAEHLKIPVFVCNPTPNDYWLPYSSCKLGWHACFHDLSRLDQWLKY